MREKIHITLVEIQSSHAQGKGTCEHGKDIAWWSEKTPEVMHVFLEMVRGREVTIDVESQHR